MVDKIGVLQIVGDPVGGIRKHVHSILYNLSKDERFILSYAFSIAACDSQFVDDIRGLREAKIKTMALEIRKKPHYSDLINILRLILFVKNEKIKIIHGHGAKGGLYARVLSLFCGTKAIYTPHGGVVHKMFSPLANAFYLAIEKCLYYLTDYFIFESNYTAQAYHANVKKCKNFAINHNGINPIILKSNYMVKKANDFQVGVFGMLRRQKGQIHAIDAVDQLIQEGKNLKLHLYGDGPDKVFLENRVAQLNHNNIIFHGDVSSVEKYMFEMDVIIIPSIFESFGYVAVEAMALKKPVIASNVGGLTEIIKNGETGFLVSPGNVDEIKKALLHYLDSPDLIKSHGEKGYARFTELFHVERMINRIMSIYLEVSL